MNPCVGLPNVHGVIFVGHPVFLTLFTTRCVTDDFLNISAAFDSRTFECVFNKFISNTLTLPLMVDSHMLSVDDCRASVNQGIF